MIIGNFNYDPAKNVYAGDIKTLTLLREKVHFRPVESKSDIRRRSWSPVTPCGGQPPAAAQRLRGPHAGRTVKAGRHQS